VGITFGCLSASYWIDNLGFLLREKLAAIFITPCSWGFPTGRSFTRLHQVFLAPLPGNEEEEEEAPTSTKRQQNITSFSSAVAGEEEDFCKGSFRTHILYFVLSFALPYFTCIVLSKTQKK
jgi:hypothetical protein